MQLRVCLIWSVSLALHFMFFACCSDRMRRQLHHGYGKEGLSLVLGPLPGGLGVANSIRWKKHHVEKEC